MTKSLVLKPFQKYGVKFLRANFEKHQSCVLNDEAALGKTVQIIEFLQSICQDDDTTRILVVTQNSEKMLHWKYHLDNFSQLTYSTACEKNETSQVILTDQLWCDTSRSYRVVVLEADWVDREFVAKLKTDMIVFKTSVDITLNLDQLHLLASHCLKNKIDLSLTEFIKRYSTSASDSRRVYFSTREKLLTLSRPFRLRRQKFSLKDELPLIDPAAFTDRFAAWRRLHVEIPPAVQQPVVKTLSAQSSDSFLAFDRDTQAMSPLIFDSESECGDLDGYNTVRPLTPKKLFGNITLPKLVLQAKLSQVSPPSSPLSIPETQQSPQPPTPKEVVEESDAEDQNYVDCEQYAQVFKSQYSMTSTPDYGPMTVYTQMESCAVPSQRPKTPSPDVEIVAEPLNTPIYVQSSSSGQGSEQRGRKKPTCYSPDMFAATSDDEAEETDPNLTFDSPLIKDQSNFLNILNKTSAVAIDFDTPPAKDFGSPISKELINAKAAVDDNVFEITANEEFCNQLRINSDTEMSPIRVTDSDDGVDVPERRRSQKRKRSDDPPPEVYELFDSEEMDAERENNNKTPDCTPSQRTPSQRSSTKQRKSTSIGKSRTPVTPQVIKPTGWLSATPSTSGQVCSASPKRKTRRRKLETMFPRKVFSCDNEPCSTAAIRMEPRGKSMRQFIISPDSDY